MATATEIRALTEAHRVAQSRRAATLAALVALYYRHRVKVEDPRSVERWLEIMLPRILRGHDLEAEKAAAYGNKLRVLEMPGPQGYTYEPTSGAVEEQIRKSLETVGPYRHYRKATSIRESDESPTMKRALLDEATDDAVTAIAGAVARHVQNGGRQTLYDNIQRDPVAMGYIRVTKPDPCYFCAALASRGIVYGEDSFDESDPRFTGSGTAKVHDSCGCTLKPVYTTDDPMLIDTANFEALWYQWGGTMYEWRRRYEGREDGPRRRSRSTF